jgi:lipopolysaccharide biosynthesis glycosyltransferase
LRKNAKIYIGYDPREFAAFSVARYTLKYNCTQKIPVYGLILQDLIDAGLYTRPHEFRKSALDKPVMWDVISDAPMSTQHANARFLVPQLAKEGWALFCDGDMLFRDNVARLFEQLDHDKAVYCVQHKHSPKPGTKMDGQEQTRYARKNWTSFIIFNCDHEANQKLTPELVNSAPGRDLHRLCWLDDNDIGDVDMAWNWLVGHSDESIEPKNVHFTEGVPDMVGYENVHYADEWRDALMDCARGPV